MSLANDELIEYEDKHWEALAESFIEKYAELWGEFVIECWTNNNSDYLYEQAMDRKLEEAEDRRYEAKMEDCECGDCEPENGVRCKEVN